MYSHSYGTLKEVFDAYDMKTFELMNLPAFLIFSEGFKELGKPWPTGKDDKPDWVSTFNTLDELAKAFEIDACLALRRSSPKERASQSNI